MKITYPNNTKNAVASGKKRRDVKRFRVFFDKFTHKVSISVLIMSSGLIKKHPSVS